MAKKVSKKVVRKDAGGVAGGASGGAPARRGGSKGRVVEMPAEPGDRLPPPARVTFEDVVGQGRALSVLRGAIASGRLHHAWIFGGPRGVGKMTTALAFAGAILDPTTGSTLSGEMAPDPESAVQRLIASGTHPDLHVITKELARFSEDRAVRERKLLTIPKDVIDTHLIRPSVLAASVAGHGLAGKVFIVDEAELLDRSPSNAPTQNAILKTLEEPPAGTVIILVTSAEDRLLPTIRSRCQRVAFGPLTAEEMSAWMARSGVEVPAKQRGWLLEFAEGSPGALVEAVRGGLAGWHERLESLLAEVDKGAYSGGLGPAMASLIDEWAEARAGESKQASKEAANHEGARLMLRLLASHYRTLLRGKRADVAERAAAAIDALQVGERELHANVRLADMAEDLSIRLSEAMGGSGAGVGGLA